MTGNIDSKVVDDFGREWREFNQSAVATSELERIFGEYFSVFPWARLPQGARGFDLGCGSGRWAKFVAPRVGELHCIDASEMALQVARTNLSDQPNCHFHHASVDAIPLADSSMDFGYSLGVLHHVPDTGRGLKSCVSKLKRGAPMLLYLYYSLDNRSIWYRAIWLLSDGVRRLISRLPHPLKLAASQVIAATVYWPLARLAKVFERLTGKAPGLPLAAYRDKSFYTMRTDALDRFGTRLEQRFSRAEIHAMMEEAGLAGIEFREQVPFWCAVGVRR